MNCTVKIEKRKNKVVPLEGCTVESAVKEEDTRTEMTRMTQTNFWTNWHQIVTQIITIEWQELWVRVLLINQCVPWLCTLISLYTCVMTIKYLEMNNKRVITYSIGNFTTNRNMFFPRLELLCVLFPP